MDQLLTAIVAAAVGALVGPIASAIVTRWNLQRERTSALRDLRDELIANRTILNDVRRTRVFLRDEAWVGGRQKGALQSVSKVCLQTLTEAYAGSYGLNDLLAILRGREPEAHEYASLEERINEASNRIDSALNVLYAALPRAQRH